LSTKLLHDDDDLETDDNGGLPVSIKMAILITLPLRALWEKRDSPNLIFLFLSFIHLTDAPAVSVRVINVAFIVSYAFVGRVPPPVNSKTGTWPL